MKQTIQKVEAVLNSLECGFKFTKETEGSYCCLSGNPIIYAGMTFDWGLGVNIQTTPDGVQVEYQCAFESEDCNLHKEALIHKIMQHAKVCRTEADNIIKVIWFVLEKQYNSMFYRFGPEFERRLPDIHIVDRIYSES